MNATNQPPSPNRKRKARKHPRTDYDSPWKEAIEQLFSHFIGFFFPAAFAEIDWARDPIFMDKELQQIMSGAATGRQVVDKLVKVWLKDGKETYLLIHIEVQSKKEADFDRRMFIYNTTLFLTLGQPVVSLAILADETVKWHPQSYSYGRWGFTMGMTFPSIKLLAYREQWAALEAATNLFALVVMAYLKAQATRKDNQDRLRWKIDLVRALYAKEYTREQIYELLRFIHWVLVLPRALEQQFEQAVREFQEEKMKYLPEFLQDAMDDGIEIGELKIAREMVTNVLTMRFPSVAVELMQAIQRINDIDLLKELLLQVVSADSVDEVTKIVNDKVRELV